MAIVSHGVLSCSRSMIMRPDAFTCTICLSKNIRRFSGLNGAIRSLNVLNKDGKSGRVYRSDVAVTNSVSPSLRHACKRTYCSSKPPDVSEIRNINPLGNIQSKVYYFDTLAVVQKLVAAGFTENQAVGIKDIVQEVLHSSIDHQTKVLVTKAQMEITTQQMMTHINSVKKDMVILEKSEFSMLRNENEKQTMEILQLKKALENELDKLKGHVRLDINLEKSRATEAHAQNEKNLQMLHNKIEMDVANVRTLFESYKNDVFKYSIGTALTAGATVLAVLAFVDSLTTETSFGSSSQVTMYPKQITLYQLTYKMCYIMIISVLEFKKN
ncbi:coiled-coil domain-containing protein 90B, mitochondrial-like [Ostrea edulis]|uniref:coiled-coil domain-containing protein 90B, mitochondrial-like n=1 Tax=Ostrea edulis TaxID=37623 RepID=UPI0024AF810E|nr:coiled-coil domain-containing protein 90B, mitochondrial-like [Ostrea edulis]